MAEPRRPRVEKGNWPAPPEASEPELLSEASYTAHLKQYADSEGDFVAWKPHPEPCKQVVPVSGLPCGHPVEYWTWESSDGGYEDYQYRCLGGGHTWWIDGIDS